MNLDAFTDDLNGCLNKQFNLKGSPAYELFSRIHAKTGGFDLYLRCLGVVDIWPEKTIVIARIAFTKTRNGEGTRFLEFLVEHSDKYGYENIAIECPNNESKAFGARYGFDPYSIDNALIIKVAVLRETLEGEFA